MELISVRRRSELIDAARTTLKVELRDYYAVDEVTFDAWRRGGAEAAREPLLEYAAELAAKLSAGYVSRRVKVISEPHSEYMRFALDVAGLFVDAGEEIRWLPRSHTSGLLLPGNDFMVLDDQAVIFNVLDGDGGRAEQQLWTDADTVARCYTAFSAAWEIATPHAEYCRV